MVLLMTRYKEFIKNRKGQRLAVLVERQEDQKGLAFVMHGLGGFKEGVNIQAFRDAFYQNNYTVVRFDATNGINESDGKIEDATVTGRNEDLEDIINWSKNQEWYQEPFVLASHSLGGLSIILYAEKYPEKVKGLAPISTVISTELSLANFSPEFIEEWKEKGYIVRDNVSRPGVIEKITWSLVEDSQKYNILSQVDKLTMPVLLIVGERDVEASPEHQKILYDKLPGRKEIHIIKDAKHDFVEEHELEEIKQTFDNWINSF